MSDTTIDTLLGGRFEVEQPAKGYRIAVDTLLLASAVPVCGDQKVLELGCGVGGAMLALASRERQAIIHGLEIQSDMAALCDSNIRRNGWHERLSVEQGDIALFDAPESYDHVMMNPPYHDPKAHVLSPHGGKRLANALSGEADLALWIVQASRALRVGGVITMIHRGDKMDEITGLMRSSCAEVHVKPILSKRNAPPKRIIVRGIKSGETEPSSGQGGSIHLLDPFNLYGPEGRYAPEADSLLREAAAMVF